MGTHSINLQRLYQTALSGIHRAYVFMRLGARGVSVGDFDDTELPGRKQIGVMPEPMPLEQLNAYLAQFRAWTIGNGLRELVESYALFLDEVYACALSIVDAADRERRLKIFERHSLREKVRSLFEEFEIDGGFSTHLETFTAARNALTHGAGIVRAHDCGGNTHLIMTWRGIEVFFVADDGVRYRVGDEPADVALREPLETITVDRHKRWQTGERVELSTYDLAEITYMANHEAAQVLDALGEFGRRSGATVIPFEMVKGG